MNWVDIIIIVAAGLGAFTGWRMGLLGGIFNVIGIFVGIWVASHFSQSIAGWIAGQGVSNTIATVLAYVAIVVGLFIAAQIAKSMTKKALSLVFLGWIDTAGSILVGLVFGFLLAGGLILGLARLSTDMPTTGSAGAVVKMTGFQAGLQNSLVKSELTGVFIETTKAIPGGILGFVPGDFRTALDRIDQLKQKS